MNESTPRVQKLATECVAELTEMGFTADIEDISLAIMVKTSTTSRQMGIGVAYAFSAYVTADVVINDFLVQRRRQLVSVDDTDLSPSDPQVARLALAVQGELSKRQLQIGLDWLRQYVAERVTELADLLRVSNQYALKTHARPGPLASGVQRLYLAAAAGTQSI